jgi:RNA 2',3'-cyclic 3'-phosphodiesterase
MRVFIAVELDAATRAAVDEAVNELRHRLGGGFRARWVPQENMHLTVRFIGHVADAGVGTVLEALRPALAIPPFDLVPGTCGVFPVTGPPRILWMGLEEGTAPLQVMHEEFNRRLRPLGYEPETRPFSAHLTLARVKDAPRGSGAATREALRDVRTAPARCRVTHATVFESRLSPNGPRYTPLAQVPFIG